MSDLTIFTNTLRDLLRAKKLAVIVVLLALSTGVATLWRINTPAGEYKPDVVYNGLATVMIFSFILVILAIVFGTAIIAQEVEQKTIVYLLIRPVPRWRLLLMKFAAVMTLVTGTAWLATILLALVTEGPTQITHAPLLRDLAVLPFGALAYGGLSLLLGTLLNRPLIYGLLFAFGWESWVPSLGGSFSRLSLMTYLRVLAPHPLTEEAVQAASAAPDEISQFLAWSVVLCVIVLTIVASLWIFSTNEYVPREDSE